MFFNVKHLHISLIFSTFVHMKKEDNILILNRYLLSELTRMSNLLASKDEYIRFLENENKTIENETRAECLQSLELIKADRDNAYRGKAEEARRADVEKARADRAKAIIAELKATIGNLNARVSEHNANVDVSFLPCDYVRKYGEGQDDKDAEERYMNLEIKEENVA